VTDEGAEKKAVTEGDESEDSQPETPTNIQTSNNDPKYEDISLPDNSNHKAVVEVYYKRILFAFLFVIAILGVILYQLGVIAVSNLDITAIVGSILIIPIFIIVWILERRANS